MNRPTAERIAKGIWWDRPWTLVDGCTEVSEGCEHCWGRAMARRFKQDWTPRFRADRLEIPLRRKTPTVYVVWNDLFHPAVSRENIDAALEVMAACPQHRFLTLTKRPERMESMLYEVTPDSPCRELGGGDYLPNLWLGVTAENQARADERIPLLLQTPAVVRFVSVEPMLGALDVRRYLPSNLPVSEWPSAAVECGAPVCKSGGLDWVICGGETGPNARPMHPAWARALRDQCHAPNPPIPFFFTQWGEYGYSEVIDDPKASGGRSYADLRYGGGRSSAMIRVRARRPFETGSWRPLKPGDHTVGGKIMLDADTIAIRIGVKRAGRLLDGREWSEFPSL